MLTLKVLTFGYSPSDFQRVRLPTSKECYVSCFIDLVTMEKLKKLTRMIGLDYSQFPNSMLRLPHNLLSLNFPNGRIWMDHLFCREAVLSKLRCNIHHKIGMISFFCNCWVPWSSIWFAWRMAQTRARLAIILAHIWGLSCWSMWRLCPSPKINKDLALC